MQILSPSERAMGGCPSAVKKTLSNPMTTNEETKAPGPQDVTANFPNDGLCHVLSYISPLQDRFRVAAVNSKFRRCMLREMKTPMPLDVLNGDWEQEPDWYFNGKKMSSTRWEEAVQVLAGVANFSRLFIRISCTKVPKQTQERMDRLFNILCEFDCLGQVTHFYLTKAPISLLLLSCSTACADVIARCRKLSALRVTTTGVISSTRLAEALKNKRLTEVTFKNTSFPHQEVIDVFRSLKQNTLQNVHLAFRQMSRSKSLALPELIQQLGTDAWAALERIRLELSWSERPVPQLGRLFQSLGGSLPSLEFCKLKLSGMGDRPDPAQFAPAIVSLFNRSSRKVPLKFKLCDDDAGNWKVGCGFMEIIRQLQDRHPVQVELDVWNLKIASSDVVLEFPVKATGSPYHGDNECAQCRDFYPNVIKKLSSKASDHRQAREVYYLRKNRLDWCKVATVVEDCNSNAWSDGKAVRIDQTHQLATVTFQKFPSESDLEKEKPFYIHLNCGPCVSKSCVPCILMSIDH